MSRRPVIPPDDKLRIVLSVLANGLSVAKAARHNKVSKTAVSN
jgi:transposase-like protein